MSHNKYVRSYSHSMHAMIHIDSFQLIYIRITCDP